MKTYLIKSRNDLADWFNRFYISKSDFYPVTIQVFKGDKKHRSLSQNALSHVWYKEIADQAGDRTPIEVKRECKLMFGVPILLAENEAFRNFYEALDTSDWEQTKEYMDIVPVTSQMTVKQMSEYLEAIHYTYTDANYTLTHGDF